MSPGNDEDRELRAALEVADRFFKEHAPDAPSTQYLTTRGIPVEQVRKYGLGYAPAESKTFMDRMGLAFGAGSMPIAKRAGLVGEKEGRNYPHFRNRITFPIRDVDGTLVGFGSRRLDAGRAKYLNTPETALFKKSKILYGLHEALQGSGGRPSTILVVEGYLDVVSLSGVGIDYAVSPMGVALTRDHVTLLLRHTDDVSICFDGDPAGWRGAYHALPALLACLRGHQRARFMFLPDGEDPDSMARKYGGSGDVASVLAGAETLTVGQMVVCAIERDLLPPIERTTHTETSVAAVADAASSRQSVRSGRRRDLRPTRSIGVEMARESIEARAAFLVAAKRYLAMIRDPDIYLLVAQTIGAHIGVEPYRVMDYAGSLAARAAGVNAAGEAFAEDLGQLVRVTQDALAAVLRGMEGLHQIALDSAAPGVTWDAEYEGSPVLLREMLRAVLARPSVPRIEAIRRDAYFQARPEVLALLEDISASPSLSVDVPLSEGLDLLERVRQQAFEVRWQDLNARLFTPDGAIADEAALAEWQAMINQRTQARPAF